MESIRVYVRADNHIISTYLPLRYVSEGKRVIKMIKVAVLMWCV